MRSPGRRLLRIWIINSSSFISSHHHHTGPELLVFNEYVCDTWKNPNTPIWKPSSDLHFSSQLTCASRFCDGGRILLLARQSDWNGYRLAGTLWQTVTGIKTSPSYCYYQRVLMEMLKAFPPFYSDSRAKFRGLSQCTSPPKVRSERNTNLVPHMYTSKNLPSLNFSVITWPFYLCAQGWGMRKAFLLLSFADQLDKFIRSSPTRALLTGAL